MKALLAVFALAAAAVVGFHLVANTRAGREAASRAGVPLPAPGPEAAGAAAADGEARPPDAAASLHERFDASDQAAEKAGRRVYYQFVDESGAVHFVDTLDQVPAAQRDRAGRIEIEPRPARSDASPGRSAAPASAGPRPFSYDPDSEPVRARRSEVVVYTTSWCGYCRKTIAWLDAHGVAYENRDIESNGRWRDELVRKTGRTSIPVVEVDGELVRGFDPRALERLLGS